MPISVKCNCGASFKAQDHLAGKKVKCPKCQDTIQIPRPQPTVSQAAPVAAAANPMLDLLDEAGVERPKSGPTCPACNSEMAASAIICVNCGYNVMSGTYLDTYVEVGDDPMGEGDPGMSSAQKIMAKAERSISDMPETAEGQDFGDGADAYVVAIGAVAMMTFFVVVGVVIVLAMEQFGDVFGIGYLSFLGLIFLICISQIWIAIVGFFEGIEHGLLSLFFMPYAIYYGFSRGLRWQAVLTTIGYVFAVAIRSAIRAGLFDASDDTVSMIYQTGMTMLGG